MKRTYEAMLLLDNREVKQGWQTLKDNVTGFFTKHGADIKSARRWDERRLAYSIDRQLRGTYLLVYFESETSALGPIRRELEYAEPVMRHLTHVCEEIPTDAYDPEEEFDEESVRVETEGDKVEPEAEADAEEGEGDGEDEGKAKDKDDGGKGEGDDSAKAEGGADAEASSEGEGDKAESAEAASDDESKKEG